MKIIYGAFILLLISTLSINAQDAKLRPFEFSVMGNCGMCKDRIESTAKKYGAAHAEWSSENEMLFLLLDIDKYKIKDLRMAIAVAGHDNPPFLTPKEVYGNLHGCCQYRPEVELNQESEPKTGDSTSEKAVNKSSEAKYVDGYIYGIENGKKLPLIGANVILSDSFDGTVTDVNGYFKLDNPDRRNRIEVSYIGFETKEIDITDQGEVNIVLDTGHQLETIEITYKKRTTEVSFIKPLNVENITQEELCKAACCNLSESFETNPSVDVSFTDAITGTRQIQMLGLAGPYVQITRELIPDIRAMSSIYGLNMTPGPWIESIQLIKGVGSVVNGYESVTGQINVELKKPERGEDLFINGYINNGGRYELNANMRKDVSSKISAGLLLHGKRLTQAHDRNEDSFTDMPLENDYLIVNRWKLKPTGNFQAQLGMKLSSLDHKGGFHDHFNGASDDHQNHWRMLNDTKRYEVWGKLGYVSPNKPEHSIGLQLSAVKQNQDAEYGFNNYDSEQKSVYANLIYQFLGGKNHIVRTGLTYQLDVITEEIAVAGLFERNETVPGTYLEYTYQSDDKFSIIPGIRVDQHSDYGTMVTPRIHTKYNFSENSIIRGVAGKGWRTASVFAENMGMFSSSRDVALIGNDSQHPYGFKAEEAWNYGLSFTQGIEVSGKQLVFSTDFYRTNFKNQIIVDYETPGQVAIYNLDGKSYSNSFQAKVEYELVSRLDIRMAYRLFDVKTDYRNGLLEKPLVSRHRAFVNAAYKTSNHWHFDMTVNWNGQKRLPYTGSNPVEYRRPNESPDYFLVNTQIMKRWNDKWDVYVGAENLLNYKQTDAIIAADDPFGQYFDASIVWAPLFGANIYAGFRLRLGE